MIEFRTARLLIWLLCATPMADLLARALTHQLGANPQEALLRGTGLWCLTMLLVTLGVTPLRRLLDWPELIRLRRMLGLWTFAYAVLHLLGFWAFEHEFDWIAVLKDGAQRPFVTVGLVCFALLVPLAATSNQLAMRRLRSVWKRLHRLVYLIAMLGLIHFFLHRAGKSNFADPMLASVVTAALLLLRVYPRR